MNAANQRRLTPLLIVLTTILGAIVLVLLAGTGRSAHWAPPHAVAALPAATGQVDLPQAIPLQQFSLVWTKPLFSLNRKPFTRVAEGGSTLGDLTLTGILLTPGLHMALLQDRNGDKQVRLREGQALPDGSVTLVEVRARSALFDSAAGRSELKLAAGAPIDAPKSDPAAHGDGTLQPGSAATAESGSLNAVPVQPDTPPEPDQPGQFATEPAPMLTPKPVVTPAVTDGPPPRSAMARRAREEIRRRRAAKAAAANEGVR